MAWRLARRELDLKFRGLRLLLACLFLGVGALAAIGSLTQAIQRELASRGAMVLGGDLGLLSVCVPSISQACERLLVMVIARAKRVDDKVARDRLEPTDKSGRMRRVNLALLMFLAKHNPGVMKNCFRVDAEPGRELVDVSE